MIFPRWIKKGDTIGVTATSAGITFEPYQNSFRYGAAKLAEAGYKTIFTKNVFTTDECGRSSDAQTRAGQLNELMTDHDVSYISLAAGGDFLCDMLPYVDFNCFKDNPKWIQGYSDSTALLFPITTLTDTATIYGPHFRQFGVERWDESVLINMELMEGRTNTLHSLPMHQTIRQEFVTGLECPIYDTETKWKNALGESDTAINGRLLGGCMDVLFILAGTSYEATEEFTYKYRQDGIIWFMESFDARSEYVYTALWKMREMGWFKYTSGFVFGRPLMRRDYWAMTWEKAVLEILAPLGKPIIFDADIGHVSPQLPMINGAKAEIRCCGGHGIIKYNFNEV